MMPPSNATSLPSVQDEHFEGPLDLLLDEVRRQNVSVEKVAMAPIVARFLEYMRTAAERNLNLDIDWLHMAATLIHWKSQSLLPADIIGRPAADPIRDGLVQQLLTHRKQAAGEFARRQSVEEARFARADGEFRERAEVEEPEAPPFVSVWDMIQQARELSRWVEQRRESHRETFEVEQDDVTIAEMMDYLGRLLADGDSRVDGARLLQEQPTASRRACLFLGMLEMMRNRQLELEQNEIFGPLWLTGKS
jgi:segregation and condensation protein A